MISSLRRRFIGDRAFYKTVILVALPIMIQNGITNFVSLLDNIMVGRLGTEPMSGVAIVNQLNFIFILCIFGAVSGAGIFTAQFYGKGDDEGIRQTFRVKMVVCTVIAAAAIAVLWFFKEPLINLFLHDSAEGGDLALTLALGEKYLTVILIGLLPWTVSCVYADTLRETGETFWPMLAGFIAVLVNCAGNYVLIFGHFGAPQLGVVGAAIATVASRFVEMGILIVYTWTHRARHRFITGAFRHLFTVDGKLLGQIALRGTPLLINEALWSMGMSALTQCYSTRGLTTIAGFNIANTVINVFNISYLALGTSVGIIIGKYLGAGEYERAEDEDRKLIAFSVCVGVVMGVILFAMAPLFPQLFNTTDEARTLAARVMRVMAFFTPVQAYLHSCYFTIRSGGKTLVTFFFDSVFVCAFAYPIIRILTVNTALTSLALFAICDALDIVKVISGAILIKKKIWISKIV